MAKITDNQITITFETEDTINLSMSDDAAFVYMVDGAGDSVSVPRSEVEQFAAMLFTWAAEHPTA